jgi:hypothetical protein
MSNPGGQKLFNRFILNNPAQTTVGNAQSSIAVDAGTLNHQSSIGLIPSSASLSKSSKRLGTTKVATLGYTQGTLNVLAQTGASNVKAKENATCSTTTPQLNQPRIQTIANGSQMQISSQQQLSFNSKSGSATAHRHTVSH